MSRPKLIRARFKANERDYRPVVWPIRHPYWCTGYGEGYARIVAYADNLTQIRKLWPEASEIQVEEVDDYEFSERFPRPDWFKESPRA